MENTFHIPPSPPKKKKLWPVFSRWESNLSYYKIWERLNIVLNIYHGYYAKQKSDQNMVTLCIYTYTYI